MSKSLYKNIAKKKTPKAKRAQIRITETENDTFMVGLYVLLPNKNAFLVASKEVGNWFLAQSAGKEALEALQAGVYDEKIKETVANVESLRRRAFEHEYKMEFSEDKENEKKQD